MHGVGRTVFSGDRIEEFQVDVLGVLENLGPKQSVILARLSGGPLSKTGVLQGMSGSPVYIDGKLVGAVALAFTFSTEPIAGIQPIEQMLALAPAAVPRTLNASAKRDEARGTEARLVDIATPLAFGGFTRRTIDQFASQWRELGLEPMQGAASSGRPAGAMGDPSKVQPGSMISVQLLTGDLAAGADGTVTYVDGERIYAFGHRFIAAGRTELPFARSEVLTLLPNLSNSFKISSAREWMGSIVSDTSTGVSGAFGRRARMIPLHLSVTDRAEDGSARKTWSYEIGMASDPVLTPLLTQMAIFNALDATERGLGGASLRVRGEVRFDGSQPPVQLNNMYAGDFNVPAILAMGAAVPIQFVLGSGFDLLQIKDVTLSVDAFEKRKQLRIDQVWTSKREVKPGETVELTTVLSADNGQEVIRKVKYAVPVGAAVGTLYFTVADGTTSNFAEIAQLAGVPPRSPEQVISTVNKLRDNSRGYIRVWRNEPGFKVQGQDLPDPPPSVAMLLARSQTGSSPAAWTGSKVAEYEFSAGDLVISGSKTVQVEVKE